MPRWKNSASYPFVSSTVSCSAPDAVSQPDRRFMSQTPLLSIVAAVYNGEKFLAQFFECIEQQQLDGYELILVNDGSTDNSLWR